MGTITGIVVGILILSVMMFVHELGHFLTGRRLGFTIEEFAIFMGPVVFSWQRKNIKYSLKLFPIGASVRFAGEFTEDGTPSADPGFFYNRPKWARSLVLVTGPALNLLSGILALLLMFSVFGYTIPVIQAVDKNTLAYTAGIVPGERILRVNGYRVLTTLDYNGVDLFVSSSQPVGLTVQGLDGKIRQETLVPATRERYRLGISSQFVSGQKGIVVESVEADSNNGHPVLKQGDILLAVNGIPYESQDAFLAAVENSAGQPLQVSVTRNGQPLDLTMVATKYNDPLPRGIYFASQKTFLPAVGQSFLWPWSIIKVTLRSIGMMFTGALRPQDTLSGPVGVVTMITDVVQQKAPLWQKLYDLLWLFALISVSLGFMNLLPIPPLDGNHLVLIAVEAVRGKRLSIKTQNLISIVGVGLIILLALAGLIFDVMRLVNRA